MKHTLFSVQRRIYTLQLLLSACAIVLLLQVGARLDSANAPFSGNTLYGPPRNVSSSHSASSNGSAVKNTRKAAEQRRLRVLRRKKATQSVRPSRRSIQQEAGN